MDTEIGNREEIEREAAEWFTVMHAGDVTRETRDAFEAWLHGARARKTAYRAFEQVYRDLDLVAVEAGVNVDEALGRNRWTSHILEWVHRPIAGPAALAASILLVAAAVMAILPSPDRLQRETAGPHFATAVAEVHEFRLEDGSVITLGPKTRIEKEFTPTARTVTLLEGQAFFEVAKDPGRPFFVAAQDTLVRVVGTKFDVKRGAGIVHVSVLEGVVEVMKPSSISETIETGDTSAIAKQILTAGERVSAARRVALPEARQVEQAEPGAWREGRLAYEDASLAEIIADVSRYYDRPIRIASSDVGDLRSTIAINTSEIDQVFDVLSRIHPIEVERPFRGPIVIKRKL